MIYVLSILFVVMFGTLSYAQNAVQSYLINHGHALLIGVSAYTDPRWPALPNIRREIATLDRGLSQHFEHIDTLIDPTTQQIRNSLYQLTQQIGRSSSERLFVYYAGHGFTDARSGFTGYITGSDTPAYDVNRDGAILNSVSMREFDDDMRSTAARQVMAVFDSCFSGTIFTNRSLEQSPPVRIDPIAVEFDLIRRPVRAYISAGRANEAVPANSKLAELFLAGIEGAADKYNNGFVTGTDLGIFLQNAVLRETGGMNTPQFGKTHDAVLSDGEFVFAEMSPHPQAPSKVFNIFFDWDRSVVTPEAATLLQQAADAWKLGTGDPMQVTGYTDRGNDPDHNKVLSEEEANNVARVLQSLGVPRQSMQVSGLGEKYNRVPTGPGVREPQNRRVEIVIP